MCLLHGHEMGMKSATHGFGGQPAIFSPYKVGDKLSVTKEMTEEENCHEQTHIALEITDVRVERVKEITEMNSLREGLMPNNHATARGNFALLWNKIYGSGAWDNSPFVWVIEFKRIT